MLFSTLFENIYYFCNEFFMVLDFKVNRRLVVGMTINFFYAQIFTTSTTSNQN